MNRGDNLPFKKLGDLLTQLRTTHRESIEELSGAIELDMEVVQRYERGEDRPSEDILSLIADHFNMKDEEVDLLWEVSGYNKKSGEDAQNTMAIPVIMMPSMNTDPRIIYTDNATVTINNYGVVMNFMQTNGQSQPIAVARVGMSIEHAKSIA